MSAVTIRYRELGATDEQIRNNVLGIELDDIEAEKSAQYGTTIVCKDFSHTTKRILKIKLNSM